MKTKLKYTCYKTLTIRGNHLRVWKGSIRWLQATIYHVVGSAEFEVAIATIDNGTHFVSKTVEGTAAEAFTAAEQLFVETLRDLRDDIAEIGLTFTMRGLS